MLRIYLHKLRVLAYVGVYAFEQKRRQPVDISVGLEVNDTAACRSDKLNDTVDYEALAKTIGKHVGGTRYVLVERLASEVLDLCQQLDERVVGATVEVFKPKAIAAAQNVSVQVSRVFPRAKKRKR